MNYVIFDLEWNGCYCKKLGYNVNEIIEIGAVKLNEALEETDRFSLLIRPEIGKRLSSSVENLTSITTEELKHGVPFKYAYSKFKKFCNGCVLMTWSTSDIDALVGNVRYHFGQDRIDLLKQYADLQQYCHDMLEIEGNNALGLQSAVEALGIDTLDFPQHRALDDSMVSAMCLRRIYQKERLDAYITPADDVFYEKLFFKPYYITDLEDENIDKSQLFFHCDQCGSPAKQIAAWHEQFKSFVAEFECPVCHRKFKGRIQFRKKYDSVEISKKILSEKKEEH